MSERRVRYRALATLDRQAIFAASDASGETTTIAFGDGRTLPYRSFTPPEVFRLAEGYLLSPESTVTALDMRRLYGVTGAMLARQSRIQGTVVDVLMKEFLVANEEESRTSGIPIGELKRAKLDEIIERILIQYGDDSVQELEWATVLFNSVSNLATKAIEDRRLGGFIEQSSRYVYYTEKDPVTGRWWYLREERIMASPHAGRYVLLMDRAFACYARLVGALTAHYETVKPLATVAYALRSGDATMYRYDDLTDAAERKEFLRIYKFDIKTRACDTARVVLPASTLTNVAMVANGRTFEHLLKRLYSSRNPEFLDIAVRLHETLRKVIPKYVKRAQPSGDAYTMDMDARIFRQLEERFPELLAFTPSQKEVAWIETPRILGSAHEAMTHMLAATYFASARVPFGMIVDRLVEESPETLNALLAEIIGVRASRRDRAPRSFETGYPCAFEIVANFGVFRDLHRHRMLTQERQRLNPHLGFTLPADIAVVGMEDEVRVLERDIAQLYDDLEGTLGGEAAQYCVLFGHHIRFTFGFSLREAQHLLELRTVPQGHPDYRRVCQTMARMLIDRAPWIGKTNFFTYVDERAYPWSRADAEVRQSKKRLAQGLTAEE